MEGEDVHPHSTGNTGSDIVICDNPEVVMTDVNPNAALAHSPTIPISTLIANMQARFKYKISYGKAWWAKQMAIKQLYCDWDALYNKLQGWITVMREYVPRAMTTNLIKAVNAVLRRTRHLPILAIFSATFYRLAMLMSRIGQRQVKQIEVGHIYVEGVQNLMKVIARVFCLGHMLLICEISVMSMGGPILFDIRVCIFMQYVHAKLDVEHFIDEMSQTGKFRHLLLRCCRTATSIDILKVSHSRRGFKMTWISRKRVNPNSARSVEHLATTDQATHIVFMFAVNLLIMPD
ncbi:hypothetical protein GOBAR_AA04892 [Gossypium barbadense]|uniref:Uncharacterized protein n=1 Tax=Gossypium barbadense TaxID=3634 RepID=A0A2P5YJF1_GOSBA|nr:hypothetical protein GOBAR_AA04892 [Gossypium barbadense]